MYGETCVHVPVVSRAGGLSPHVRGNRCLGWQAVGVGGSIRGLSPHVRGNRASQSHRPTLSGSIPACTGKPSSASVTPSPAAVYPRMYGVYPRMYGETQDCLPPDFPFMGLSPHVRGNPSVVTVSGGYERSIPACTGKPSESIAAIDSLMVYPRMYGETHFSTRDDTGVTGLSPHVRGNRRTGATQSATAGSIPACTGKPTSVRATIPV